MAEYIDREAVIEWIDYASDGCKYLETGVDFAKRDINAIPAADVIEVVRCKDCRFTTGAAINMWNEPALLCGRDGDIHPGNWFCAAGERENNDD